MIGSLWGVLDSSTAKGHGGGHTADINADSFVPSVVSLGLASPGCALLYVPTEFRIGGKKEFTKSLTGA